MLSCNIGKRRRRESLHTEWDPPLLEAVAPSSPTHVVLSQQKATSLKQDTRTFLTPTAGWLPHVPISSNNVFAALLRRSLASCSLPDSEHAAQWHSNPNLVCSSILRVVRGANVWPYEMHNSSPVEILLRAWNAIVCFSSFQQLFTFGTQEELNLLPWRKIPALAAKFPTMPSLTPHGRALVRKMPVRCGCFPRWELVNSMNWRFSSFVFGAILRAMACSLRFKSWVNKGASDKIFCPSEMGRVAMIPKPLPGIGWIMYFVFSKASWEWYQQYERKYVPVTTME